MSRWDPEPAEPPGLFWYDDLTRRVVLAAKNGARRDLLRPLGRALAETVPRRVIDEASTVAWVPASPGQLRRRGYDQGQLLARSVARSTGLSAVPLLRRVDAVPQVGRTRGARTVGPKLVARRRASAIEGGVLLVDDVRTTGSSLRRAAEVLGGVGLVEVFAATIAVVELAPRARATIYGDDDSKIL